MVIYKARTGVSLITVLPEQLQSPLLTAEWEYRLQQVERGELSPDEFMTGIADMLTELVKTYQVISGAEVLFPSGREIIGKCPRCGSDVTESKKGFFCEKNDCRFGLWRDNKFFAAKRAALTKKVAAALLADGRVKLTGLYSEKTGGTYDAKPLRTAHAGDVAVSKAPRSALYASGLDIWIRLFSEMPHQAKAQSISPRAFRFIRSRNPHCRRPRR